MQQVLASILASMSIVALSGCDTVVARASHSRAFGAPEGEYLGSDIPWNQCSTGWGRCIVDKDFKTDKVGQIDINGDTFSKGYVAHAAGSATFTLDGRYASFSTCIGISKFRYDGRCGVTHGDARFRVLGDGRVLRGWEAKGSPQAATCFTVSVKGIAQLTLETDLNGSRDCDMSTWANARVTKPKPKQPTVINRLSKDYTKPDSERKAQLKHDLNIQDGDCLDALDTLMGGSSDLYGCFKQAYDKVESAFCEPPRVHGEALGALRDVDATAGVVKTVSGALKNIPKVGAVAKVAYMKMKKVQDILRPRIEKLGKMNERPHGEAPGDSGCCQPLPKSSKWPYKSCSSSPGASYKCGSCSKGQMCNMQKGCNTLRKVEGKLDRYFDDFVERFAEAARIAQDGENEDNEASWLWTCKSVSNKCSSLKNVAEDVASKIRDAHDTLNCPWNFDVPSLPDLNPLKDALRWLKEIKGIFDEINNILKQRHCVPNVPWTKMERVCIDVPWTRMERHCVNVGFKRICSRVPVPTTKRQCAEMPVPTLKDFCFSAADILNGVDSALSTFFGPIKDLIEDLLQEAMQPILGLLDPIINAITPDINFGAIPNLPSFDFGLPNLPQLTCGSLSSSK